MNRIRINITAISSDGTGITTLMTGERDESRDEVIAAAVATVLGWDNAEFYELAGPVFFTVLSDEVPLVEQHDLAALR